MKGTSPGEGQKSFPSFFLFSLFPAVTLGCCLLFSQAIAQKPEREGLTRFDRLAEEATLLNKRGQYDQVISLLQPHKDDRKNDSALFFNELGIAYRQKGKLSEAVQAYTQALSRDPQNPVILNNLGYTHYLKKEYAQAIERYQQALQRAPRFKEAHSNLSLAYYQLQKFQEALEEIETVLKLDPNHEQAKKFRETIRKKLQEQKKGK